jgi:dsDNA-specific endonuclease/ATPase MutS2
MNQHTIEKLQYNQLIENLKTYCSSNLGREEVGRMSPSKDIVTVKRKLQETTEARKLLDISNNIGLSGTENIRDIITDVEKDIILNEHQLCQVFYFLMGCQKIKNYMADKEFFAPYLYLVSKSIIGKQDIMNVLDTSVKNGRVVNEATTALKNIRRHMDKAKEQIDEELIKFIKNKNYKAYLQESFVSVVNGRQTIPVKASYKNMIEGTVIDSNGKTVFIEPKSIRKFVDKLTQLKIEETDEEYKILCQLTGLIYDDLYDININIDTLAFMDLAYAKGKYSKAINAIEPQLNNHGYIKIVNGKHMLLTGDIVPLNVIIEEDYRSLIITGPNAGGKTVVLKTIGLLTMAIQTGLHIPCDKGTNISVFERIFADVGDDQSMENALSTFSSHVKNLARCVNKTNKSTLLLFDEIGSGTEPNEGAALAIAILEDVYNKGAITIATTHYNEIKSYAVQHPDFETAAMRFDQDTLAPLYKLIIGKSGESNALWISKKMGIYEQILTKAEKYMTTKNYDLSQVELSRIRHKHVELQEAIYYDYKIGDKIYVKSLKKGGLVYKPVDSKNFVQIYSDQEILSVHVKLLTLESRCEDLYPQGYDMDQLFVSYKERKLEKDVKRGSKKTLKKIQKLGIEEILNE